MNIVREYVQDYINELQSLLDTTQDDAAFIKAVEEKWPKEDDLRCSFVVACQNDLQPRLGDQSGEPDGSSTKNVLVGKQM
jgi:hypothetical protein